MRIRDFTNTNKPVVVIINILHPTVSKIVDILLEQEAKVVLVDYLSVATKEFLKKYKTHENVLFIDLKYVGEHLDSFKKINYIFFYVSQLVVGSSYPNVKKDVFEVSKLSNREFVNQSNYVDMFIKLAIEFDAKFSLITSGYLGQLLFKPSENNLQLQRYSESLVHEYLERGAFEAHIIRVAEIIDEDLDLSVPTFATRLIRELVAEDRITILGEGLQNNYIVSLEDATLGILNVTFSKQLIGKEVLLTSFPAISTLNLAYKALELIADEKQVEFIDATEAGFDLSFQKSLEQSAWAPELSLHGWTPQGQIEKMLKGALAYAATKVGGVFKEAEKSVVESVKGEVVEPVDLGSKNRTLKNYMSNVFWQLVDKVYDVLIVKPINFVASILNLPRKMGKVKFWFGVLRAFILVGIIIFLLPYMELFYAGAKIVWHYKEFKGNLTAGDFDKAYVSVLGVKEGISKLNEGIRWLGYWQYLGFKNKYVAIKTAGQALEYQTLGLEKLFKTAIPIVKYVHTSKEIAGSNFVYLRQIVESTPLVGDAYQDFILGKNLMLTVGVSDMPWFLQKGYSKLRNQALLLSKLVEYYKDTYELLPFVLGYKQRVNYAFVYQNNYEIRPTGGWITGITLLSLENGNIKQFNTYDVYQIDGQIRGIIAPKSMQTYLGIKQVKLATSNWEPDYGYFTKQVENLLAQKNYLPNVNVLVSIDFYGVEKLLDVLDGVEVEGFGNVNSSNLFDIMVRLHKNFKPGSKTKQEFFAKLADGIVKKLKTIRLTQLTSLGDLMIQLIAQRHIQVYSKDLLESELFRKYKPALVFQNYTEDAIGIVEWNDGGNKVNKKLTRFTKIEINPQEHTAIIKLEYENKSAIKEYPYGDYTAIMKIYLPAKWKIVDTNGLRKVKSYQLIFNKGYRETIGEFTVPVLKKHAVEIKLQLPDKQREVVLIKQPGYLSGNLVVNILNNGADEVKLKANGFSKTLDIWTKQFVWDKDINIVF